MGPLTAGSFDVGPARAHADLNTTTGREHSPAENTGPQRVRVGTDLVRVADVAASVEHFGDRYLKRLFTDHEVSCCRGGPATVAAGLAARFAAKEATIKVLQPRGAIPDWRSIEVRRDVHGRCDLLLSGSAARLAREAGITDTALSLSHEGAMAVAVVVALCGIPGAEVARNIADETR